MTERRERGTGSLKLKGNIWWVKFYVEGKAVELSSRSRDRKIAVAFLGDKLAEVRKGAYIATSGRRRLSFAELGRILLDDYRVQGNRSLRQVERTWERLTTTFGHMRASQIKADHLKAYASARIAAGRKPATVVVELAFLRRALSLAVELGRLPMRPKFPKIKVDNARPGFVEPDELRALMEKMPAPYAAVVGFGYFTGWRLKSEVMPLTWRSVDFNAGVVRLEGSMTKNGKAREFPFSALPELDALLRERREATTEAERRLERVIPLAFTTDQGKPIKDMRKVWRQACKDTGLTGKLPHDLRRSCVRNLERSGVSRSVGMALVGHETEAMYRRYGVTAEADLREGVAKLATLRNADAKTPQKVLPLVRTGTTTGTMGVPGGSAPN